MDISPPPEFAARYNAKAATAEAAVASIPDRSRIGMGMAINEPPALLRALADRVDAGGVSSMDLWYFHSLGAAGQTVLQWSRIDRIHPYCMFLTAIERALMALGRQLGEQRLEFVPTSFFDAPRMFSDIAPLDVFILSVAPMDERGFFSLGTGNDYASAAARTARRVIVEVNPRMPRVHGDLPLHIDEVDLIVTHDEPLPNFQLPEVTPVQQEIASLIAEMIDDGACLQMGIGALPAAVCDRLSDRKDLGVHTELFSPPFVPLIESGAVSNRFKRVLKGVSAFTFALGDEAMYRFLDDNPAVRSAPVTTINNPAIIALNPKTVSVNATLQVDFTGACNSEHVMGHQYSGAGGALDFVRGAQAAEGGLSIIACESTAKHGAVSRIVPNLNGPVTVPRNDVHYIVTEYGVANLRGLSLSERRKALIRLAHPKFREELERTPVE